MPARDPARLAVLVSGSGTNLQALLDAIAGDADFGAQVAVVASDRQGTYGIERASAAGVATEVVDFAAFSDRAEWDQALGDALERHRVDAVVSAGFMRLLSPAFLARWPGRVINLHPALLPAFRGAHAVRDALAFGVRVTGSTVHFVDEQVDHGPIIDQVCVEVRDDDDEASLHDRIKAAEHAMLPRAVKLLCAGRLHVDGRRVRVTADARR